MNTSIWSKARWSPYAVGVAIGVLSWVTFAWMGKALGASTTMVHAAGAVEHLIAAEHVEGSAYFQKYLGSGDARKPLINWQFALVVALLLGGWIAARASGTVRKEVVPDLWAKRFGNAAAPRLVAAFVGGIVMIFGARLAGGCTSGHSVSGGLQLAVSSWVFTFAMFGAGAAAAITLFGRGGK